jgi:aminoglycoside phosphotransferase (APT) family kinase protein
MSADAPEPVPGLDLPAVVSWAERAAPGILSADTTAQLIHGGRSNLTYLLTDGDTRVVLRRPPLGHVLATAHDMTREHRVLTALVATSVPVPTPLALCEDADVTGAPFYLMSYVEGRVIRSMDDAASLDRTARTAAARAMMDVLADLHAVAPDPVGLAGFGRPDGFLTRQVRRWGLQLKNSRSRDLAGIDDLHAGLAAHVPESGPPAIVHGDYRLDNLLLSAPGPNGSAGAPRVLAVLDWEMATLGDPLADVGLLLAYWDVLSEMPGAFLRAMGSRAGFPAGDALVEWYADRYPARLDRLAWYTAFGLFKLAVICEGIHYRFRLGQTVGEGFEEIGEAVPALIEAGLDRLGDDPGANM